MISPISVNSLTVVLSRGQSRAPEKRALESAIYEGVSAISGIRVLSIPHLYDLPPNGDTIQQLKAVEGDLIFISWVFPRASRWVLDRVGIRGREGAIELGSDDLGSDDEQGTPDATEEDTSANATSSAELPHRVIDQRPLPDRNIYCLDFRDSENSQDFIDEVLRIHRVQNEASLHLRTDESLGPLEKIEPLRIDEEGSRRWYPVIDYSRCTNCMECIDFCLFGVYGVDNIETILVEQPDNCRKGCPACSRVCPENAIMFPQHKTPAIAGANTDDGTGLKIDLSLLFGAPEKDEDPIAAAARERDEQLLLAGRAAVGLDVGIPKRHTEKNSGPKDSLDHLIDELDALDL